MSEQQKSNSSKSLVLIVPIIILLIGLFIIYKSLNGAINEVNINLSKEAYQYLLLGAIVFIALLALPRLQDLSISPSGVTLKLLQEAQKDVQAITDSTDPTIQMDGGTIINVRERALALNAKIETLQALASKRIIN